MQLHIENSNPHVPAQDITDQRVEVIIGETLTVTAAPRRVTSIELLDLSMPCAPSVEGNAITFPPDAPGFARFKIVASTGEEAYLDTLACEPEVMDVIPGGTAVGGGERDKRKILRSICRFGADWFSGKAAQIPNRNLAPFGV